jgi:hypothetical protein
MKKKIDLSLFLRHRKEGRTIEMSPVDVVEESSQSGYIDTKSAGGKNEDPGGVADALAMEAEIKPIRENAKPLRRRIFDLRHKSRLMKFISKNWPWRELTDEEKIDNQKMKELIALRKLLESEADIAKQRITNALTRNNLCYRYPKSSTDLFVSGVKEIEFSHVVLQEEAIWLLIATQRLPRGVSILAIVNDQMILTDLSLACGRRVTSHYNENVGAWLIIERAAGVRGIPRVVIYDEIYKRIPPKADSYTIPLGLGINSKPEFYSLIDMPHALVAGSTDTGKSNMVNVIITTLARRNTVDDLRLIMIDLKGGLEFSFFENLPHLLPIDNVAKNGIVYDHEGVVPLLEWLLWEGKNRIELIGDAGHKDINSYNARRPRKGRLPRLVLLIDEWAEIALRPQIGRNAEEMLSRITSTLRAAGIHVIVATQTPKREVISTLIKNNLTARFAFGCADNTGSLLIIDSGDARGLSPQGRYIFRKGINQFTVQAPLLPESELRDIINDIVNGSNIEVVKRVTEYDILRFAIDKLGGSLSHTRLREEYKGRITQSALDMMLSGMDDNEFEIDDKLYKVEKPAGKRARTVTYKGTVEEQKQGTRNKEQNGGIID